LAILVGVTLLECFFGYVRQWGKRVALVGLVLLLALSFGLWVLEEHALQYAAAPAAIALVVLAFIPALSLAERTVWLWFSPLFVLTLFAVYMPDTHVYIFFLPWFLVVGNACQRFWNHAADMEALRANTSAGPSVRGGMLVLGACVALLLWGWTWQVFADAPAERYRQWTSEKPVGYWYPFDEPPPRANMGFPLRNGWKSIGVLYAQGALTGGIETNARPEVVDWYTRGYGGCPDLPARYVLAETVETADDLQLAEQRANLETANALEGAVMVNGVDRLVAIGYGALPTWLAADESNVDAFNALAVSEPVARRGRVLAFPGETTLSLPIGDGFILRGFRGGAATAAQGETISLELFWESTDVVPTSFTVFLQLVDTTTNAKAAQTDALPVCGQNPTDLWRAGDKIVDPQNIVIFPDAAAGAYTLYVGMYDVNTGARLPISLADRATADWYPLMDIEVE
jgi:hypothetical protein